MTVMEITINSLDEVPTVYVSFGEAVMDEKREIALSELVTKVLERRLDLDDEDRDAYNAMKEKFRVRLSEERSPYMAKGGKSYENHIGLGYSWVSFSEGIGRVCLRKEKEEHRRWKILCQVWSDVPLLIWAMRSMKGK